MAFAIFAPRLVNPAQGHRFLPLLPNSLRPPITQKCHNRRRRRRVDKRQSPRPTTKWMDVRALSLLVRVLKWHSPNLRPLA